MRQSFRTGTLRAATPRRAVLVAIFTLGLTGCGSTATTKPTTHQSTSSTQALAFAPAHRSGPRVRPAPRHASTRRSAATQTASAGAALCPVGERRTATGLCYSPAAQTKLAAKLGPCPAGQVVADNGACQPLTTRPPLPARCRRPNRAGCIAPGSLQGGGPKTRGPGFDPVFH